MDVAAANQELLDSWRLSLVGDRKPKATRTVALYLQEADRFARWLEANNRPAANPGDLLGVSKRDIEAWIVDHRANGTAENTVRNRWVCLRNLYGWAHREGEVDPNPIADIFVSKPNPPAPDTLTDDAIKKLLKVCEGTDFYARRDTALIRLLLATGLRVSECTDLTLADLDLNTRIVRVLHGKGDKARAVRFDPGTAAALDRYKRARARHRHAGMPWLWVGFRGRMTRKGVPAVLDKRAAEAGIGHVHAHQLRHTWADRWLRAGGNEGDLQRLGGWESPDIMRRYGEAQAVDRALAAYDNVDPMAGL